MSMVLRFGVPALIGSELFGRMDGVVLDKDIFGVHGILINRHSTDTPLYPFECVEGADQDRVTLIPTGGVKARRFADADKGLVALDRTTRIYGSDGWVSVLAALEIDARSACVTRFIFNMGHPLTRLVGVEGWFVKEFLPQEISFALTVEELKEYPAYLTNL